MCMDRDDLYERAQWDGAAGTSRRRLLEQVQGKLPPTPHRAMLREFTADIPAFIPASILLPPRRLATLLDHARRYQQQFCRYHTSSDPTSLYSDHRCASGHFPSETSHILVDHEDEVHNLAWSPDGNMLATAGHDKMVVIWRLDVSYLTKICLL